MKVLGLVQWTNRDKGGHPIAGVLPLVELQKTEWRPINAAEEFPSQGQVFWPNAQIAIEGALVIFSVAPTQGHKDEYKVVDPRPAYEILDLRSVGAEADVRSTLVRGISEPTFLGTIRVLVWCKPNVLVGPVEVTGVATGGVKLKRGNLARVPFFTIEKNQVRYVHVDRTKRLLRVDDSAPTGYVDWDDDAMVVRRALETAVRVAKQDGRDIGQTKKQIEDAAQALISQGVGSDAQIDRYRLVRALSLLENTDVVTQIAGDLVSMLREHPIIKASLNEHSVELCAEIEQRERDNLKQQFADERAALKETSDARDEARSELLVKKKELEEVEGQLTKVRGQVETAAKEAEAALEARVLAVLDRPLEFLAEVSVLRPFLGISASKATSTPANTRLSKLDWSRARGEAIKDKVSLRGFLTNAARAWGVEPSLMLQIHAAVVARLMPVTLGPAALAALTAYGHGACGGRLHIIHVSPSAIHPHDFDDVPGGGLLATVAAEEVDGISMVILEGVNRSPLEASVIPLLQMTEVGLSPMSSARGLRLAASLVLGATTVPVTPQLWSHAAAIHPEPKPPSTQTGKLGDIALSSDLLVPGDEPTEVIEELLESWSDCRELRPAMCRFGSALNRFYDNEARIADAVLNALVLPYIATALTVEEQSEALNEAKDADGSIANSLRRMRRRLR